MTNRKRVPSAVFTSRLEDSGGFSFSESRGEMAEAGSYASQWGTEQRIPGGASSLSIDQFRSQHADQLSQRDAYLGGWRSEGADYIDVSKRFNAPEEATEFARRNAQLAAFDLDKGKELPVDYGASSLPKEAPDTLRSEYNELGRSAVDAQLHGRADPSQAKERGAAIADKILQQETLQKMGSRYASEPGPKPESLLAQLSNRMARR